jgi:hypothetical protein
MLVLGELSGKAGPMDAERFRALADRCRELARVTVRDEVRQQLRDWAHEFDAEAEAGVKTDTAPTDGSKRD